jgi:indoleamine 2,3-dioxygenase
MRFRGETGAQDSIIPSTDNAFGLEYPRNSLTEYLFELRKYRPYHHRQYINNLRQQQKTTNMKGFAMEDTESTLLML